MRSIYMGVTWSHSFTCCAGRTKLLPHYWHVVSVPLLMLAYNLCIHTLLIEAQQHLVQQLIVLGVRKHSGQPSSSVYLSSAVEGKPPRANEALCMPSIALYVNLLSRAASRILSTSALLFMMLNL
jgi:hypothetical protein